MKASACEPCAKRKVRCDKGEPCSNCKRRKNDHCIYVEASPFDKIKKLEALVRELGGNSEADAQLDSSAARPRPDNPSLAQTVASAEGNGKDPVVLEEDGQPFYLESRVLHPSGREGGKAKNPFLTNNLPNALQGILCNYSHSGAAIKSPSPHEAVILWKTFNIRVKPLTTVSFSWALESLYVASLDPERWEKMSHAEQAFMSAIYLISVVSLTDEECEKELGQSRPSLLSRFDQCFEAALSQTNLLCMTNITMIKALTLYMMAGSDRLSTQSIWSLMGLVVRNAEKLGVHRDGTLLGLSPAETEDRRRLWWQIQHLDLGLAVKGGLTPLTLVADWDSKLPLNIEDEDITRDMKEFPQERTGLTRMSYCLFTYWVIDQQRNFFRSDRSRMKLSWQTDASMPHSRKANFIGQLEEGLNEKFLRFCDPIKPVDMLTQIVARALMSGMRERSLLPLIYGDNIGHADESLRQKLLDACVQSLEYNIVLHSQLSLKRFRWWIKAIFPWAAFMCLLVEMAHQNDPAKVQRIWELIGSLYSANEYLSRLSEDRRRLHAAELIVTAWKAHVVKSGPNFDHCKPEFVMNLEAQLHHLRTGSMQNSTTQTEPTKQPEQIIDPITPESLLTEQNADVVFDLDFQDIDWAFWSSIDQVDTSQPESALWL